MSHNTIAYILYFIITTWIIVVIGKICYKNGNIYVAEIIPGKANECTQINNIILLAYYLLNIGYCATTIMNWNTIETISGIIEVISKKMAIIIGIISILHYLNIIAITKYLKKIIH